MWVCVVLVCPGFSNRGALTLSSGPAFISICGKKQIHFHISGDKDLENCSGSSPSLRMWREVKEIVFSAIFCAGLEAEQTTLLASEVERYSLSHEGKGPFSQVLMQF